MQESKLKFEGMSFKQVSLYKYLNQEKTGDLTAILLDSGLRVWWLR